MPKDIYTKLVHSLEMTRSEERLLEVLPHCYKHITQLLNTFGPDLTVVQANATLKTFEITKSIQIFNDFDRLSVEWHSLQGIARCWHGKQPTSNTLNQICRLQPGSSDRDKLMHERRGTQNLQSISRRPQKRRKGCAGWRPPTKILKHVYGLNSLVESSVIS